MIEEERRTPRSHRPTPRDGSETAERRENEGGRDVAVRKEGETQPASGEG